MTVYSSATLDSRQITIKSHHSQLVQLSPVSRPAREDVPLTRTGGRQEDAVALLDDSVELIEALSDDWYRQTDDDDTEHRAADADDSALVSVRNDVPVADGGHGDEGPPVGVQHVPHTASAESQEMVRGGGTGTGLTSPSLPGR